MARQKKPSDQAQVDLGEFMEQLSLLDSGRQKLAKRELTDYLWISNNCEKLRKDIDDEGLLIEGNENPKLAVLHKLEGRKSTMFSQIMKWLPTEDEQEEEIDELDSFLNEM